MKLFSLAATFLTLVFLASNAVEAKFTRKKLRIARRLFGAIRRKGEVIIFDDVHLPKSLSFRQRLDNLLEFQKKTNKDVFVFSILPGIFPSEDIPPILDSLDTAVAPLLVDVVGEKKPGKKMEPRSEAWLKVFTKSINRAIKVNTDDPDPCEGFLYFGNQDFTKILSMLCQCNPFFASALTVSNDDQYLELVAYLPGSNSDAKYLNVMKTMTDTSHRINVRFNMDMTVNQIINYESGKGVMVPENEWDYYASGVLYNLTFYASAIHATIHVLHYLMTAAIKFSTAHDKSLAAWASPYDDNIAIKYLEVAALLFSSNLPQPPADTKVITGKSGFGGTEAVKPIMKNLLCFWGSCKNEREFTKGFLLKDLYATAKNPNKVIKDADILTEVNKHFENVEPFANDLSKAMMKSNKEAFLKAENELTNFMSGCGKGVSSVNSISSWVQLMCCTGIVHGSTLSYSRLLSVPEIIRWRNIGAKKFDTLDTGLTSTALGTIQGMTVDRHVFTGEIRYGTKWNTGPISDKVKKVLDKYNDMAEELKIKYMNTISKREDFREFGWILTDHCSDGYDGKQHTITTYI